MFDNANFGCDVGLPSFKTMNQGPELDLFGFEETKDLDIFAPMRSRTASENQAGNIEVSLAIFGEDSVLKVPGSGLVREAPKETVKKAIQKAKSVRGKRSTGKRKNSKKGKKRMTLKLKAKNIKVDTIDSCSTVSNTTRSLKSINEELSCMSPIMGNDVTATFKLNTRGVKSNIPQIFNSALFSNSAKPGMEDSTCFVHSSLVKKKESNSSQQLGTVHSFLSSLKSKKQNNFEAGSYMASLETTIASINKMKTTL